MKLAILVTLMKRFGAKGFYNSQEIGLGRALADMGHSVTIYKGVKDKSQVETVQISENLTIHYLAMPCFVAHGYMPTKLLDPDLDGILCFSDQQIFLRHVADYCARNQIVFVPYIGVAHSFYINTLRGRIMDDLFKALTLPIYKRLPLLAKTDSAKQELEELGIAGDRITVSPVGIDVAVLNHDFLSADRAALRRELGFEEDDVILCNVSRLEDDKRPFDLLEIFMHVRGKKKFKLLIVGKGPLREEMDRKIAACGVQDEVKILESVPYQNMWKIYTASDYYINMSKREIFGMAIMEAVYYRSSVAAARAMGPSITLKDMRGHTICDSDAEIEAWITGPYPSEEDLAWSAARIERDFSWRPTAEAFVRQIEEQKAQGSV